MSMQLLTLFQLLGVAILYVAVFILLPALTFHRIFEGRPVFVRFTAYLTIGNFYVINLVFLLQLLHISNRTTLILGVVIPMLIVIAAMNWQEWVKASLVTAGETTHNVMVNTMGFRLLFTRIFQNIWQAIVNTAKALAESISLRWIDWIGTGIILALTFWQYGTNLFQAYGYTASDMLVHNYWINSMNENDIFIAGIYPFGFHCVIYYLHAVFGIESFVILRVFSVIETALIHLMLVNLLRQVCKLETMAYVSVALYLIFNIWGPGTFSRYFSALPQEYGMIFILPAVSFLLYFLQDRESESGEKGFRSESTKMLLLFAMSLSITLAAHFYDTIALGIIGLALVLGFCYKIFRKDYLPRLAAFGVGAIVVAILPLWIAYQSGTPMEGSLRWGMSILNGYKETDTYVTPSELKEGRNDDHLESPLEESTESILMAKKDDEAVQNIKAEAGPVDFFSMGAMQAGVTQAVGAIATTAESTPASNGIFQRLLYYLSFYLFLEGSTGYSVFVFALILIGIGFGILSFLRRDQEHGSIMIACSLNIFFFCIVMISKELKIPVLMDRNRSCVYMAYFLILLLGLIIDYVLQFFMGNSDEDLISRLLPAIMGAGFFIFLALIGMIRNPSYVGAFQKNGAIVCVTNILKDNPKNSFTILSANDELRMIEGHGYHYESYEFLVDNLGNNASNFLIIPTSKVYIFVEKIPGVYDEPYVGGGTPVSKASASKPLPVEYGILMYKGERRHILMSKLYYWVQEFHRQFENEISVYYEDEDFVCYLIEQNVDRPYDMSITYGYNN